MGNQFRTFILLAGLTVFIVLMGRLIGGPVGMIFALVLAGIMNLAGYWFSDKIVLSMYGAREVSEAEAPELYHMVRELAMQANLPMPKVYIIPSEAPNAFATGRNPEHAAVAVTEGILRLMEPHEIRGVLGHELAHVKNRDILIQSVAATLAGAVMVLADMARWAAFFGGVRSDDDDGGVAGIVGTLALAIIAPIAAMLIQLAISRSREYLADETGAKIAGNPEFLASALEKLGMATQKIPMVEARPATAHMFIVNPLTGGGLLSLFSTHPPIEERVRRLRAMALSRY
ncbi:zinc metalloprotease HtpX [Thermodesulforhabdus norvegica]|uniref:Protease HtpX homolog n=1 Tax=Thermodesulforhabdus norvegica TaxID=39841 RepID=A0A1I4V1U1_9BACT|nr:zinc metalloprotease HtpX [Thermodesulforhabdus norvegica]SFM95189.1 Heat shock protein. Metallo peptidase. MEROPS family M48B [Thermodesulforhabdus norvegica]